ncbi:extracellular solute-binding protein [Pseudactinotalea suaedae]
MLGAGAVGATALASCSGGGSSTAPTGGATGIPGVDPLQLAAELPGVRYPENYVGPKLRDVQPFHDGSKTFKVVVQRDAQVIGDWNTNAFSRWLEEKTGMKVEYEAVLVRDANGGLDMTRINAMIASGDMPDAFLNIPFTNDQISLYGSQGAFVAVDDLIETYAPQMREALENYPQRKRVVTARDGRMYQFRGINDCYHCHVMPGRIWVNQRYLDAVGAEIPTTTDEFREMLRLLKENDPTPGKNIIPLAAGTQPVDTWIMNAFLYNPGGTASGGWMRVNDGAVEFVADLPEWREGLRFMRSLTEDGTIGRELFTTTGDDFLKAGNQGRLGVARALFWGQFIDIDYSEGAAWRDYVSIPPLKGPDGIQFTPWDYYLSNTAMPPLVITSACENPELLVQWGDAMMSLEGTTAAFSGIQGENWGWADETMTGFDGRQAVWYQDAWPPPEGTGWSQQSPMYRSHDYLIGLAATAERPTFESDLYQATLEYEPCAPPIESVLQPVLFDEAGAAEQAQIAASVHSHVTQSFAKFTTGELDINDDGAWQGYVEQFEAMGMTRYLELYQAAYDEQAG